MSNEIHQNESDFKQFWKCLASKMLELKATVICRNQLYFIVYTRKKNESKSIHRGRLNFRKSCFQTVCIYFVPHHMKRNFEMQSYKISWMHYKIIIEKFIWIIRKHLWRPYVNFIQLKPSSDWTAGRIFQKIFSFGLISSVC